MSRLFSLFIPSLLLFIFSCSTPLKDTGEQARKEMTYDKKFNQFLEDEFEKRVALSPMSQTYLGRKTNYDKLDSQTEEMAREELELDKQSLKELFSFNRSKLSAQEQLSYDLYKKNLESSIESYRWRFHGYPLNQMFGYHSNLPSFLMNMHSISTLEDALAYIKRMREFKRVFGEYMLILKKQEVMGIAAPNFVYAKVIDDAQNILRTKPLIADLKQKLTPLKISADQKAALINESKKAFERFVAPAYSELIQYVEHLDRKFKNNLGAWSLPEGERYYRHMLREITTTDLSPETIHQTGLKDVARIHKEMESVMRKVEFEGELKDFFKHMQSSKFQYPNTQAGKKAYLKESERLIETIKKDLPKVFKRFPKADLVVKAVEPYREKSAGIAFYSSPSLEGNRPGIYYVNLHNMEDNPKYEMEALAYHEGIPGHHMQLAIAKELEGIPTFRKVGGHTAYIEGWGLYSELLPKEMGYYQDPYSDFGRLSMELWRAVRLVVDTGIHYKKWSRERAIEYVLQNTPSSQGEAKKGIERYFVMPAQATAYKVGMLKILKLRAKAKAALGEKFDLAQFHDVILKDGSLPLDILERKVEEWIAALVSE